MHGANSHPPVFLASTPEKKEKQKRTQHGKGVQAGV